MPAMNHVALLKVLQDWQRAEADLENRERDHLGTHRLNTHESRHLYVMASLIAFAATHSRQETLSLSCPGAGDLGWAAFLVSVRRLWARRRSLRLHRALCAGQRLGCAHRSSSGSHSRTDFISKNAAMTSVDTVLRR
ncbi:MAG: hypothetical protein WCD86_11875 [Ktedonobacteraceae bacterium]